MLHLTGAIRDDDDAFRPSWRRWLKRGRDWSTEDWNNNNRQEHLTHMEISMNIAKPKRRRRFVTAKEWTAFLRLSRKQVGGRGLRRRQLPIRVS